MKESNRPFETYNGGKNGSGVYQAIINQIPPHDVFISGFAGNCGVLANKRRASMANIAIDLDASVVEGWSLIPGINAQKKDAIEFLEKSTGKDKFIFEDLHTNSFKLTTNLFIFLDPPYLSSSRTGKNKYYKFEMSDPATHKRMLSAVVKLKCNCLIIHYPNELYDEMLSGWRTKDIQGRTRRGMRTERMYMNYPEPTELHDYSYIGENFRQRELFKKSKINMIEKFQRMTPLERNYIVNSLKEKKLLNGTIA